MGVPGCGVVYHLSMGDHRCLWDPDYPEHPGRLLSVLARSSACPRPSTPAHLAKSPHLIPIRCEDLGLLGRCTRVPARDATRQELLRCHSPDLLDLLERTASMTQEELMETSARCHRVEGDTTALPRFDCLYLHPTSWAAAVLR